VERYRRELYAQASRMRADGRADHVVQQTFLGAFAALRSGANPSRGRATVGIEEHLRVALSMFPVGILAFIFMDVSGHARLPALWP
jgi:hypothetical protein